MKRLALILLTFISVSAHAVSMELVINNESRYACTVTLKNIGIAKVQNIRFEIPPSITTQHVLYSSLMCNLEVLGAIDCGDNDHFQFVLKSSSAGLSHERVASHTQSVKYTDLSKSCKGESGHYCASYKVQNVEETT